MPLEQLTESVLKGLQPITPEPGLELLEHLFGGRQCE